MKEIPEDLERRWQSGEPISRSEFRGFVEKQRFPFISLFGPDTRTPWQKRRDRIINPILSFFDDLPWQIRVRLRLAREWMKGRRG
jgi:hypothetical protein